jgi:signal transduction histidine kinase
LSRKLKYAFILQAAMATFAIVLGAYAGTVVVKDELSKRTLREEAARFWERHAVDPGVRPPETSVISGTYVPDPAQLAGVPAAYRGMGLGFHELAPQRTLVLVEETTQGRLYLGYQRTRLDQIAMWLVSIPVALALLAIFASTWYTYGMAKRMVEPVSWLAREVARWNPREPDTTALASDQLPLNSGIETRELAGALQRMGERTRALVRRERDFTRDASHELRTPLTVIRVASDLIRDDPELPERARRSLARIERAGQDMEQVIDAFLILAREADIEPQIEDFEVRDVVYEEVEKVRPLLAGKPVELHVAESANPRLHAPPRVLAVMLGNLLRNACTFTEQGRVDVVLKSDRVEVRDTGIGMDADTLEHIYEPFFRVDQVNPAGKGMGLSIVRRLGDRFGWPVGIDSEPGRGTTAVIRFGA